MPEMPPPKIISNYPEQKQSVALEQSPEDIRIIRKIQGLLEHYFRPNDSNIQNVELAIFSNSTGELKLHIKRFGENPVDSVIREVRVKEYLFNEGIDIDQIIPINKDSASQILGFNLN